MNRFIAISVMAMALTGCTTVKPPPNVETPVAWAQTSAELGKLPAGKVVSVSIEQYDDSNYVPAGIKSSTLIPVGGIFIPISTTTSGGKSHFKKMQQFYRYAVQKKGVRELVYWDDFVVYPIGSCIAWRETPAMVVPALPQECE